jgi:large subunit ribosomal protein L6
MSRVGRKPISVPADVKVELANGVIRVEGKKGSRLELAYHPNMQVTWDAASRILSVVRPNDERQNRALHGLTRSLIANMVTGVTTGFERKLKIEGVGYQAKMDGSTIVLMLGYANPVRLTPPAGVTVEVPDPKEATTIIVRGYDKQKVGQFAAEVRSARKPEPYKGKGIRYDNEVIRRKEGKSFASGG